jgi:hypothetical protein
MNCVVDRIQDLEHVVLHYQRTGDGYCASVEWGAGSGEWGAGIYYFNI